MGNKWVDVDNDGWKDLFVAQGHTDDEIYGPSQILTYRQKPLLLKNNKAAACLPGPPIPAASCLCLGGPGSRRRRSG